MTSPAAVPLPQAPAFHYPGGRTAVLLIHGLGGTPSELRVVGKSLARAGYSAYAATLPGHCAGEAEFRAARWRDWLVGALAAFDAVRREHDTVFVGGLSMGALLALLVAAERPEEVAGCLVYSPTLFFDGWNAPRASALMHAAISLGFGRMLCVRESFPYGVKDDRVRGRMLAATACGGGAEPGPLRVPGASLVQLLKLIGAVKRCLPAIRTPTLVLHAREDDISGIRNAGYIAAHIGGRVEKILLENSYHRITLDQERDLVVDHSIAFMRRLEPAGRAPTSGHMQRAPT